MQKQFLLGCCYYPEHWERASIRQDTQSELNTLPPYGVALVKTE